MTYKKGRGIGVTPVPDRDVLDAERALFSDSRQRRALSRLAADVPMIGEDFAERIVHLSNSEAKRVVEIEWPRDEKSLRTERLIDSAARVSADAELLSVAQHALRQGDGFASASVLVVFPIRGTIELTSIAGRRRELEGRLRYPLSRPPHQRDIQVDIVQTRTAEVLSPGFDRRFFPYIYRSTKQQDDWKIFVPLIVVRDDQGRYHQGRVQWTRTRTIARKGFAKRTLWVPSVPDGLRSEVVGTVTVSRERKPRESEVEEILECASREYAIRVFETSARSLAERCLIEAMHVAGAQSGTIYLFPDGIDPEWFTGLSAAPDDSLLDAVGIPRHQHSCLRASADEAITTLVSGLPCDLPAPRVGGSGRAAIQARSARFLSREELLERSETMVSRGINNLFVAPLFSGKLAHGLVYLHGVDEEVERLREVASFLQLSSMLLGMAAERVAATRERRRSAALLALEETLVSHECSTDALEVMANEVHAFTGSDLVTVFRFGDKRVEKTVGRCRARPGWSQFEELARLAGVHIAEDVSMDLFLRRIRDMRFVKKEGIASTVVLPLRVSGGLGGALVIDYRDRQRFSCWQRDELCKLGRICSIALRLFDLAGREECRREAEETRGCLRNEVNGMVAS